MPLPELPARGQSPEAIFAELAELRRDDAHAATGETFGLTFLADERTVEVAERAYCALMWENGLDPTVYPSLLRLEQEVVGIAARHLNGDERVVGNFTSGGTESILLAVKAARERMRARTGREGPFEIVVPITAHAAFHKAAHYFGLDVVLLPVDPESLTPDPAAYADAIGDRTALLVASAPSYAHGVMDPIEAIAAVAREHDVPFHVDGCIGGWLLPFWREAGGEVPPFDFSVPGVTSISMDFHKYGFAGKGSSVILYRDPELRAHQLFVCAAWTGYAVVNPTVQSTKSGGPLASTWAVLRHLGHEGYLEIARSLRETTAAFRAAIEAVEGLRIMGEPVMSLLGFTSDDPELNLFVLADELAARGWRVQPQLSQPGIPASIHLTLMPVHARKVEAFAADLAAAAVATRAKGFVNPLAALAANLTEEAVLTGTVDLGAMMNMVLAGGEGLPQEMAPINDLLDRLTPAVRERILATFFNRISGVPTALANGE